MTRSDRFRSWLDHRRDQLRDDRGSLPMVMLVTMVGMALAAGLLPTMLVQDRATVFDGSRTNDFAAAQAGIDAAIGRIRAATAADGSGDPSKLPCATPSSASGPGPIAGTVNGSATASYSAYLTYYRDDPVANTSAVPMLCVPGSGPYLKTGTAERVTPSYAQITSTGTDGSAGNNGSAGRTITSTYVFQTDTSNIAGGPIRITPSGAAQMCMDAGSSLPQLTPSRTPIRLATCSPSTATLPQQVFSYRSDLTFQLATSITPGYPNGLCMDTAGSTTSPPAVGNPVYLEACGALNSPPFSQQWSINDYGQFEASVAGSRTTSPFGPDGKSTPFPPPNLSPLCMYVADQNPGTQVQLQACDTTQNGVTRGWLPVPTVGAGAAGAPGSLQWVNDLQFGRCMDVNGQNVTSYLIAYYCKQNPYPGGVAFNQKFTFDDKTGWLYTTTNGLNYCVYSRLVDATQVTLVPCLTLPVGFNPAYLVWKQPGNTTATPFPQRYTFVDSSTDGVQRCLGVDDPSSHGSAGISWLTISTCDGSLGQKWNALANVAPPSRQNTVEK